MKYELSPLERGDYEQMFTKSKKSSSAVVTELLGKTKNDRDSGIGERKESSNFQMKP